MDERSELGGASGPGAPHEEAHPDRDDRAEDPECAADEHEAAERGSPHPRSSSRPRRSRRSSRARRRRGARNSSSIEPRVGGIELQDDRRRSRSGHSISRCSCRSLAMIKGSSLAGGIIGLFVGALDGDRPRHPSRSASAFEPELVGVMLRIRLDPVRQEHDVLHVALGEGRWREAMLMIRADPRWWAIAGGGVRDDHRHDHQVQHEDPSEVAVGPQVAEERRPTSMLRVRGPCDAASRSRQSAAVTSIDCVHAGEVVAFEIAEEHVATGGERRG